MAAMASSSSDEQMEEAAVKQEAAVFYRTKVVQFLGRSIPIILQNDNGPCPLLAICNVLLLRNDISLSLDMFEVSQQKLLSLVAERLLDYISNIEDSDECYVKNLKKNINDAISLLPKFAKGINVNLLFEKISDFEFTSESAIFYLLGIGLYHGWIVDPQDKETLAAVKSKSYNALVGELVALETRNSEGEQKCHLEEDYVDFAAATTAALGVPCPCFSRGISFDGSPDSVPDKQSGRRGDLEEEAELMRALQLSIAEAAELSRPVIESLSPDSNRSDISISSEESKHSETSGTGVLAESLETQTCDGSERINPLELIRALQLSSADAAEPSTPVIESLSPDSNRSDISSSEESKHSETSGSGVLAESLETQTCDGSERNNPPELFVSQECNEINDLKDGDICSKVIVMETDSSSSNGATGNHPDQLVSEGSGDNSAAHHAYKELVNVSGEDHYISPTCVEENSSLQVLKPVDNLGDGNSAVFTSHAPVADFHSSDRGQELVEFPESASSSLEISEPLYEGEECILDYALSVYENQEPIYEGEMILAEQTDKSEEETRHIHSKDEITGQQWRLIRSFLKNNASQLTIFGLFCLQEQLKERELCVFFRNNHFSTMFKFNGELYLLATDQGYVNQPDLVWEKLNKVNGDAMFMTGNFTEFKAENQVNDSWDYLTLEGSTPESSTLNSDLKLALALQQEFDQQPQHQLPQNSQQSSGSGRSRPVTGPQVRL